MPNEVGKVLQTAQDDVQAASDNPLYISFSDDALGKDRHQVLDSNWKVCSQIPAAGSTVNKEQEVRFQVVKLDETCP